MRNVVVTIAALLVTACAGMAQKDTSYLTVKLATQQKYGLDAAKALNARVTQTPADVLQKFREAGMSPTEHVLTDAEREKIATAFALLPPLHKRVLKERLKSISFLDNMPNTALTSSFNYEEKYNLYHITFRAGILNETISQWLTWKENTCFDIAHARVRVHMEGGQMNALVYILLHETTHVVDGALAIAGKREGKLLEPSTVPDFAAGIWEEKGWNNLLPSRRDTLLQQISYRTGKRQPIDSAIAVYQALQKKPFVSLYGSCARSEDVAEYVTVYHLTHVLKQPFTIVVTKDNKTIFEYAPMQSAIVQERVGQMKYYYEGS
jgi:hypothetical protein